ncbi:MAG: RNA polymerase sigma factor [Phycisphaeraceae bacterium]|nr:RNA polymerase sigma factor [Phycisphaeraceae bacterium]MBX3366142.1 RNA polymerase sigma factor [Phycisphaeraceae bacterium]
MTTALSNTRLPNDSISLDPNRPGVGLDLLANTFEADFRSIATYLQRRTGDADLAREIACETYVHAASSIERWRDQGLPLRCWLLRIATRRLARHARRERRRALKRWAFLDEPAASVRDSGETTHVHATLRRLSEREADVLVLHHVEGLSIEQVAAVLNVRPGTVKSRLSRARAAFARAYAAEFHSQGDTR